jgi:UDPglucose--hexose-1-phosphate uridylyltransferase
MPELRQNWTTKEWVVMATERAKRPEDFKRDKVREPLPHYSPKCPFCQGNEAMAPPEEMRIEGEEGWAVRVVPNKFAALAREGAVVRHISRSRRTISGVGIHDVIVESPDHAATTALLPVEGVLNILQAYRRRYLAVCEDKRIVHITIFKNHGAGAGTSLEHPHSQLIATPVISHQVRQRIYEALRHYDEYGECMFCEEIKEEVEDGSRIVELSEHFVAIAPFASPTPFSMHIFPRRHMASFGDVTFDELTDLARVLRTLLAKLYHGLSDPDFNYTIRSAPVESRSAAYYHWYLSVIPRMTQVAGFELGSGMFINTVLPEKAAEFLRNFQLNGR